MNTWDISITAQIQADLTDSLAEMADLRSSPITIDALTATAVSMQVAGMTQGEGAFG